jgi:hypothetical protein
MIDRKDDIAVWQTKISALEDDEAHTSGIIALLYEAVISCLRAIIYGIKREGFEPQYIRSLEKSAATMVFWGGDHDVSRGALDKTLQHAQLLRDAVLVTLISIGDLLSRSACRRLTSTTRFLLISRQALRTASRALTLLSWIIGHVVFPTCRLLLKLQDTHLTEAVIRTQISH